MDKFYLWRSLHTLLQLASFVQTKVTVLARGKEAKVPRSICLPQLMTQAVFHPSAGLLLRSWPVNSIAPTTRLIRLRTPEGCLGWTAFEMPARDCRNRGMLLAQLLFSTYCGTPERNAKRDGPYWNSATQFVSRALGRVLALHPVGSAMGL
jgi:hypothetical protein